jgi:dTDP-4-dehydrorhamnose reductase
MTSQQRWLVVGGDGLIGKQLVRAAQSPDRIVVGTSRRKADDQPFVDLNIGEFEQALAVAPDVAILCAAVTSMQKCRDDPASTYRVNVEETTRLAARLLEAGSFVIFLSSNTVFSGAEPRPIESHRWAPNTEYGRQKVCAEKALSGLPDAGRRLAIVRLSKVVAPDAGIAAGFLERLYKGEECRAFCDLKMAPVSLSYVVTGLLMIGAQRRQGVFHLSGEEELSYFDFARKLAAHVGVRSSLVVPVSSNDTMVEVLFRPEFPALGMSGTKNALGLEPESLDNALGFLTTQ